MPRRYPYSTGARRMILAALLICAGWLGRTTPAAAEESPTPIGSPAPDTEVLALQAFFDPVEEERLQELWARAMTIEGVQCAGRWGALPHLTTGSWRVTAAQAARAESVLAERFRALASIDLEVSLREEVEADGAVSYYLIPQATETLLAWHRAAHAAGRFEYPAFRPGDLPGAWKPHVTLFTVPANRLSEISPMLEALRQTVRLRVARLGLVRFQPKIRVTASVGLR